mmetsp:Transcript_47574/g.133959  ORF Transcript_47574/g.133959 Transcript_47574/m.133959 type:complete len:165 (-) Transcript_47574:114-608(-)
MLQTHGLVRARVLPVHVLFMSLLTTVAAAGVGASVTGPQAAPTAVSIPRPALHVQAPSQHGAAGEWVSPEALVVTASSMALRLAVALRSVFERSSSVMWAGVAFAVFARSLAGGSALSHAADTLHGPGGLGELATVGALAVREFVHIYGLRFLLGRLHKCDAQC